MARIRTIKPEFFKNDQLAELPFEYRLLFQGLWCLCDRRGRMEDRPKRIKADVFPYDDVDCEAGLQALHDAGFIARYEHDGTRYIQVVNFEKHQNCNIKESESTIPAPCWHSTGIEKKTTVGKEGKGKEGKGKGVVRGKTETVPQSSAFRPPTLADCEARCEILGMPKSEAEKFWNHYAAQGWVTSAGIPVGNWVALMAKWKSGYKQPRGTPPDDMPKAHEVTVIGRMPR